MSQTPVTTRVWIARDYAKCSGCRLCEITCSLHHEGKIWPEASRVRVFMLIPGVEVPHLCTQCSNYPCVHACPYGALSVNDATGAVEVANDKCTTCGACINACPGKIPHLHPDRKRIVICDLCGGNPQCSKICTKMGFNTLTISRRATSQTSPNLTYDLYAKTPEELTENLAYKFFGDKAKELI